MTCSQCHNKIDPCERWFLMDYPVKICCLPCAERIAGIRSLHNKPPTYPLGMSKMLEMLSRRQVKIWLDEKLDEETKELFDLYDFRKKLISSDDDFLAPIIDAKITEVKKRIRKLEMKGYTPKHKDKLDVAVIKQIPIADIMPSKPIHDGSVRQKYSCPLHNEKTPSFVVYKEKNSWHCFGCGASGDVVDLYQKLNNCDFITALKELSTAHS